MGVEVDRRLKPREDACSSQAGELAVRDGDAVADAGGAQPLALQQHVEDRAFVHAGDSAARSASSCSACFFLLVTRRSAMTDQADEVGVSISCFSRVAAVETAIKIL